jgi:gluconolactonase
MTEVRELATGLQFPEGPVAMPDGSVLLVEIKRGTLTRVSAAGEVEVVADLGGGPNGAAIGPEGDVYVCNDGGFVWSERSGVTIPMDLKTGSTEPPNFGGGWIERVNLESGAVTRLFSECNGHRFCSPNDIVFDATGGFWFTDLGKQRPREVDRGGLYYVPPDGSTVVEAAFPLWGPNGVGLSPDGSRVYVAESFSGKLLAWDLTGPGQLVGGARGASVVTCTPGHLDSLAVEAGGNIVVAALAHGLCVVSPDGTYEYLEMPDPIVTNVCFTGEDMQTALVTLSGYGRLVALDWPRPGLRLEFA